VPFGAALAGDQYSKISVVATWVISDSIEEAL